MRKAFLPFSRPSIGEEEVAAVTEVLRSGWITTGPKNAEFEKMFFNIKSIEGCNKNNTVL